MTTDITELAQRIPERKSHDWSQSVMHDCDFCNQWSLTVKHENGERICASCCDAEYTSKLEVANAELVEALDKAQHRIADLESRTVKLPDLRQIVSWDRYVWSDGVYNYSQDVKVALAAAGIKVEAE